MLRRLRNVCVNSKTLASSSSPCQRRTMFHFSEQYPMLKNMQTDKGYQSNVWVSSFDLGRTFKTEAKPGEVATRIEVMAPVLYWNASQLRLLQPEIEPKVHTYLHTGKPVGPQLIPQLDERTKRHGFTSKFWIKPYDVNQSGGITILHNAQACIIRTFVTKSLFNTDQLRDARQALTHPVHGEHLGRFDFEAQQLLREHQERMKFPVGVWFAEASLPQMKLELLAEGDAAGTTEPIALEQAEVYLGRRPVEEVYNAEQLAGYQGLLKELGLEEPQTHTYMMTNLPVREDTEPYRLMVGEESAAAAAAARFSSKFWVTKRDVAEFGLQLVDGAEPLGDQYQLVRYYNISQMKDPERAFKKVGTMLR